MLDEVASPEETPPQIDGQKLGVLDVTEGVESNYSTAPTIRVRGQGCTGETGEGSHRFDSFAPPNKWEASQHGEVDVDVCEEFIRTASDHATKLVGEAYAEAKTGEWLMTTAEVDYVGARMIGLGSVGQVFKARLAMTGELIAVKVVRDDLTERTRARNRTVEDQVQEIRMLSTLGTHPNVIKFRGALFNPEAPGTAPAIIEEYLGAGSVQDILDAKNLGRKKGSWRPSTSTALSWVHQLLKALAFLHDRDVPLVHRDVKPSNIFVSSDWAVAKLGDFGLCRPVQHDGDRRAMTGLTGSFTHMAPEVFLGVDNYTERADVFSAAVCSVCMVTGEPAYSADADKYEKHPDVLARRVAVEGYRCSLGNLKSQPLAALVRKMWAGEPAQRPTASVAASRLLEIAEAHAQSKKWRLAEKVRRALGLSGPDLAEAGAARGRTTGWWSTRDFERTVSVGIELRRFSRNISHGALNEVQKDQKDQKEDGLPTLRRSQSQSSARLKTLMGKSFQLAHRSVTGGGDDASQHLEDLSQHMSDSSGRGRRGSAAKSGRTGLMTMMGKSFSFARRSSLADDASEHSEDASQHTYDSSRQGRRGLSPAVQRQSDSRLGSSGDSPLAGIKRALANKMLGPQSHSASLEGREPQAFPATSASSSPNTTASPNWSVSPPLEFVMSGEA